MLTFSQERLRKGSSIERVAISTLAPLDLKAADFALLDCFFFRSAYTKAAVLAVQVPHLRLVHLQLAGLLF